MTAKGNKPPLALDMPFGEALARFASVPVDEARARELREKKAKRSKRKPKTSSPSSS